LELEIHLKGSSDEMKEISDLALAKRAKIFRIYQLKLIEKIMLLKWEPYSEKYFFLVDDLYTMHDHK